MHKRIILMPVQTAPHRTQPGKSDAAGVTNPPDALSVFKDSPWLSFWLCFRLKILQKRVTIRR